MSQARFVKSKLFRPHFLMVFLLVLVVGFFFASPANASIGTAIATFIGWIIYGIVWALGQLLVLMMRVLVYIAEFNNFINAQAVVLGWKIVRDICNMFFVVIMLVIAFATVLRIENYSYKKLLPKLIIMAILINFSKMICGLIIDVAQVVMLTFVNSFKDVAGGNLTNMMGLNDIGNMKSDTGTGSGASTSTDVSGWSILGAYVLALIYVIIALIVVVTMVIMLAIRVVMMWIYVVLSPMAYLLGAFPAGQQYANKWWTDFSKNVIVGPIIAFFVWLSFASLGAGQPVDGGKDLTSDIGKDGGSQDQNLTKAGSPDHMLTFVISIAMLFGGLQIAQQIGGAAGAMAGKGMNAINKGQAMVTNPIKKAGQRAGNYAAGAAKAGAMGAGRMAKTGLGGIDRMVGAGLDNLTKVKKGPDAGRKRTNFGDRGFVNTSVSTIASLPKKGINAIKENINKNKELKDNLRNFNSDRNSKGADARLKHMGKEYEMDEKTKKFHEVDASGKRTGEILKNEKGEDVKKMNSMSGAWRDSWRDNNSKAGSEASKKQEKAISEKQQEMADSNMSNDEMLRKFNNGSTSATEKMALALTLAVKGGFKDAADVQAAKKAVGSNYVLSKKLNDEVDKNQTHLNYDLTNKSDQEKFKKRVEQGKINTTTMKPAAYEKEGMMSTLREYHGDDFPDVLKTARKNGNAKTADSIGNGLASHAKESFIAASSASDPAEKQKLEKESYQSASLAASLSGHVENTFSLKDGKPNGDAVGYHFKNATAKDLNKIKLDELQAMISKDASIGDEILKSLDASKLKAMEKDPNSKTELISFLANKMAAEGSADKKKFIQNDPNLSSLLEERHRRKDDADTDKKKPYADSRIGFR